MKKHFGFRKSNYESLLLNYKMYNRYRWSFLCNLMETVIRFIYDNNKCIFDRH